ncbi:hypothetical protein NHX12_020215 [Muraenolepis orangiensis]|uniref:Fish-egg lectin n=1 Tax=Muraenolepis orangiensis TaxID=630683 RepID=A0A9Q0IVL3_9TELE|nr:hypothetical protein NHX12_020215 [Muraenolepis orangiensis]
MGAVAFIVLLLQVCISHAWKCSEAPALYKVQQVDADLGKVLAVSGNRYAYYLNGLRWNNLHLYNVKHITTGTTGTWMVDSKNGLNKLVGGTFVKAPGLSVIQAHAGGKDFLVATNGKRGYCCRTSSATTYKGVGSLSWTALSVSYQFKQFSCGRFGCWGVDIKGRVYHAQSITAANCKSVGWRYISAGMKMVEASSDGLVFGINNAGEVFLSRTYGVGWYKIPMCMPMRDLSYNLGKLWVASVSGLLMVCTH